MKYWLCVAALILCRPALADAPIALVLHGGAGTITRAKLGPEKELAIRQTLREAADRGFAVLQAGGTALDAVTSTLTVLEDSPLFNAGKGAVYTATGEHELDAAIMDGATMNAGAVAGVRHVRNPILAAKAVMLQSPHVMLAGKGADAFARSVGLAMTDNHYFDTPFRKKQWLRAQKRALSYEDDPKQSDYKFGTVGAVALDSQGHLAAGTSTGGMTNKAWGRIGDSPIIGAGTYASDQSCAVSATGHGEFFIRYTVARDICARVELTGVSLHSAADEVIMQQLRRVGGEGGIIALDKTGKPVMIFNSEGMYRAWRTKDMKKAATAIFGSSAATEEQH